jgi:hypothetical protein
MASIYSLGTVFPIFLLYLDTFDLILLSILFLVF